MTININNWKLYIHVNKINNKVYIGITSLYDVNNRWNCGIGYKNQKHFYNAIKKYGWDNFEHKVLLDNLTEFQAKQYEIYLIKTYRDYLGKENVYNISDGGEGAFGCIRTEEQKRKISDAHKGKQHSEETKVKMRGYRENMKGENNPSSKPIAWNSIDGSVNIRNAQIILANEIGVSVQTINRWVNRNDCIPKKLKGVYINIRFASEEDLSNTNKNIDIAKSIINSETFRGRAIAWDLDDGEIDICWNAKDLADKLGKTIFSIYKWVSPNNNRKVPKKYRDTYKNLRYATEEDIIKYNNKYKE